MNTKIYIVLIEDEKNICNFISTTLTAQGYKVSTAPNAKVGISLITSGCPDLILLDLGLPDMDGINVIREIRTWASIPIIVISARTQEKEKVLALDTGADDYITIWAFRTHGTYTHCPAAQQQPPYGFSSDPKALSGGGFGDRF